MKIILVICFYLVLVGGLIMSAQAHNFTVYLEPSEDGANASFYLKGKFIGKADENGKVVLNIDNLEYDKKYKITIKKEGYRNKTIEIYKAARVNGIHCAYSDYRIQPEPILTPKSTAIPKSTPEILATPAPLPKGHKSQKQRITELENIITKQETKISELEERIKAILEWIKTKFGDVI